LQKEKKSIYLHKAKRPRLILAVAKSTVKVSLIDSRGWRCSVHLFRAQRSVLLERFIQHSQHFFPIAQRNRQRSLYPYSNLKCSEYHSHADINPHLALSVIKLSYCEDDFKNEFHALNPVFRSHFALAHSLPLLRTITVEPIIMQGRFSS